MPRTLKRRITKSPTPEDKVSKAKKIRVSESNETTLVCQFKKIGDVFSVGQGDVGQLGLGEDVLEKFRPSLIKDCNKIVDICAGGMHNICLKIDGKVLTWGCNDNGTLGRTGSEFEPGVVKLPLGAVQVSAGDSHSAALLTNGDVYVWGTFRDNSGNMCNDQQMNEPEQILKDHKVLRISSGADHLVMLTQKGKLFTVGCGQQGQLGRLSVREVNREHRRGISSSLKPDEVILSRGQKRPKLGQIWCATWCTFVENENNDEILAFGINNYNQLGIPKENAIFRPMRSQELSGKKWKKIQGGQHHTLALDMDGQVFVLGRKEYGRLGLGENCQDASTLTKIDFFSDKTCVDIACGTNSSFAITDNGELYSWGMGTCGVLASGNEDDLIVPKLVQSKQLADRKILRVSSGGQHTLILAESTETEIDLNNKNQKETKNDLKNNLKEPETMETDEIDARIDSEKKYKNNENTKLEMVDTNVDKEISETNIETDSMDDVVENKSTEMDEKKHVEQNEQIEEEIRIEVKEETNEKVEKSKESHEDKVSKETEMKNTESVDKHNEETKLSSEETATTTEN